MTEIRHVEKDGVGATVYEIGPDTLGELDREAREALEMMGVNSPQEVIDLTAVLINELRGKKYDSHVAMSVAAMLIVNVLTGFCVHKGHDVEYVRGLARGLGTILGRMTEKSIQSYLLEKHEGTRQ